ncbi:MAG: hypothetical protein H6603_05005 [Flavobacteriales bacterium]|nr:hypothetical protein [Flavobacteriales bacterium]
MSLSLDAGTYIMTFNAEVDGTNSSSVSQFGINVNGGIYSASEREHEPDNGEPKTITVSCVVTVNYSQTVRFNLGSHLEVVISIWKTAVLPLLKSARI